MSLRNVWNRTGVSKSFVDDPPTGMDRLQLLALAKAASISKIVTEVTLGPDSMQNAISDFKEVSESSQTDSRLNASQEDSLKLIKKRSFDSAQHIKVTDDASRCIMKQIADMDQQRELEVRELIKDRLLKMGETARIQREILKFKSEDVQRESEAKLWQEEQEILRQFQEEELRASQRQLQLAQEHKQHAQRMNARNQMIKEAEERRKELEEQEKRKIKEKREQIEKLIQFQKEFRSKYEEMADAMRSCKNREQLIAKVSSHTSKLKKFNEAIEHLVNQCKVGEANKLDLQAAAAIVEQTNVIKEFVCAEVARINEEYKKEAEKKLEKLQDNVAREAAVVPPEMASSAHSTALNDFADEKSYKTYILLQEHLKHFENSCESLVKDDRVKKFRFNCQKAVNIPVNAISPTNAAHMQDKFIKLSSLISGQMVDVGHGPFSATSHPQGVAYCKTLLAKKFVYQGEMTVSSKPEAAFAIAAIIVALWTDFPDFGQLLLAYFHKECPYLVPVFMPQVEGQSNSDYYKALGYHFSENGEVEPHDKFLKRMSGIMRLYAAILVAHPRQQQNKPNPHGLAQAWRWIACLLNLEPMPDICATLLYDFLDVTGNAMYNTYGRQFQKLLHLTAKEYFPKINMKTTVSSGPLVRLEVFLQKILKQQGHIPVPAGILPPNFW